MGDFEAYESLPESSSAHVHMTAGAAAGIAEHCVMFPVDCVKTRMQSLTCERQRMDSSVLRALRTIVREEGVFRPIRGVQVMAIGAGPAHALYFGAYEHLKARFLKSNAVPESLCYLSAGAVATVLHDAIMTPAEVVKQRMQMCCSPYASCWACAREILAREGPQAFYRSYTTQVTMNIPFQGTHFVTYEFAQKLLNPERRYEPGVHFVCGAMAGAVAATATMPLDVCKTLLNTQEAGVLMRLDRAEVSGMLSAARSVYACAGLRGYFHGIRARLFYQMPSTAISWSVYEFFKHALLANDGASTAAAAAQQYDTIDRLAATDVNAPGLIAETLNRK